MSLPSPPRPRLARVAAKRVVYSGLRWLGINRVLQRFNDSGVAILCYHNIVDEPVLPWIAAGGLHLSLDQFRRQMEYVAARRAVVSVLDVHRAFSSGTALPQFATAVTFDDGYAGVNRLAAPILERLGLPATVFLPTDYIDDGGWYWWDELPFLITRSLGTVITVEGLGELDLRSRDGVQAAITRGAMTLRSVDLATRRRFLDTLRLATGTATTPVSGALRPMTWAEARATSRSIVFGGHSASHRVLDALSLDDVLADARRCSEALQARLGGRVADAFCYPEGRFAPGVPDQVRVAGFACGVTASAHQADERFATRDADTMLLPRLGVSADMSFDAFVGTLAGAQRIFRSGSPSQARH